MDTATALATLGLTSAAGRSDWLREYNRLTQFWNPVDNKSTEAPTRYRQVREAYTYLIDTPGTGGGDIPGPAGPVAHGFPAAFADGREASGFWCDRCSPVL